MAYRCKACGGFLEPASDGSMVCDSCGAVYWQTPEVKKAPAAEQKENANEKRRCKYCGGEIVPRGDGTGMCDSCGTLFRLPPAPSKTYLSNLNRAILLHRAHAFDDAISAYEQVLAERPDDSEARWNLVLCRYGISYTKEPGREGSLLFCRPGMKPVYEDFDYQQLAKTADASEMAEYRRFAKQIDDMEQRYAEVSGSEAPYDAYLAYDPGTPTEPTEEAALAKEIYDELASEGVRTFYEQAVGNGYNLEAHRLYAIQTAKVMVLIGARKDHLETPVVRDAWMRCYDLMLKDRTKHRILPVYRDMRPEDFPGELNKIQGIDLGRLMAVRSTLVPRVKALCGTEKTVFIRQDDGKRVNLNSLLRRIRFALEDKDYDTAASRIADFRSKYDPEEKNEELHHLALWTELRVNNDEDLFQLERNKIAGSRHYAWILKNGSPELNRSLRGYLENAEKVQSEREDAVLVSELTEAYSRSDMEEVLAVAKKMRQKGNFSRWSEVEGLIHKAEAGLEKAQLRREYKKLVGDGSDYYRRVLKQKYPEKVSLLNRTADPNKALMKMLPDLIALIVSIGCLLAPLFTQEANPAQIPVLLLWMAAPIYLIARGKLTEERGIFGGILQQLLTTLVLPIAIGFGISILIESVLGLTAVDSFVRAFGNWYLKLGISETGGDNMIAMVFIILSRPVTFLVHMLVLVSPQWRSWRSVKANSAENAEFYKNFLPAFEAEEYEALEKKYRSAAGTDWVEPKSLR